jgi:hypothetical protein
VVTKIWPGDTSRGDYGSVFLRLILSVWLSNVLGLVDGGAELGWVQRCVTGRWLEVRCDELRLANTTVN